MCVGGLMGRAIFISYRRDDSEGEAGRLYDDLVRAFGDSSVFMDVAGINPGLDFRKAIDSNVASCGVLLAMIGPTWATITNGSGQRRLEDANDFVRLEIASALQRDIPVIPVLVHEARMPSPDVLPDNLRDLAYRNSVEITHVRWNSDVALLTKALAQYVSPSSATSTEPVHAPVPVQLPPPNPPAPKEEPAKGSKTGLIVGLAVVGLILVVLLLSPAFRSTIGLGRAPRRINPPPVLTAATAPSDQTTPAAAAPAQNANPLLGVWTNPTPMANNGLAKLEIAQNGGQITMHGWGTCQPQQCDWGVQQTTVQDNKAFAVWSFENGRVATVTVMPRAGSLEVTIDNSGPKQKSTRRVFAFERSQ